ncbi:MAG: flagellar hook-basal body complex protein [Rhodospirillaceae bacterium]
MDKSIYVALNAMQSLQVDMRSHAQNLANISVPGYKTDLRSYRGSTYLETENTLTTRAYQRGQANNQFDATGGTQKRTDRPLDVAILGDGYFFISDNKNNQYLSRRGDFQLSKSKELGETQSYLVDGAGAKILDNQLKPIVLPNYSHIVISELGEIFVELPEAENGERTKVAVIGTVKDPKIPLQKSLTGAIEPLPGTKLPQPDQGAKLSQAFLEGSNVSSINELVYTLDNQRRIEMVTKFVKTAKEIDESGAKLMRPAN